MPDIVPAEAVRIQRNWDELDDLKFVDEEAHVAGLMETLVFDEAARAAALRRGLDIVETARRATRRKGMMESFLEEFGLSNSEGLALMCLAEALLRVPDIETRDELIAEKIRSGDWGSHRGQSESWLVNASTWGLMLTGRVIGPPRVARKGPRAFVSSLVRESGEPVIRAAMMQAMRIMGEQFVLGRTVDEAMRRGQRMVSRGEAAHFSFDMLGEGARTAADAQRYLTAYERAIESVAATDGGPSAPEAGSGVSVKLSALHPRYDALHETRVMEELYPRLLRLCTMAARTNINLCLDAEEADRLVISLKLLERLCQAPELDGWSGLGLAVQAYQKRALGVVQHVVKLARDTGRRLMVRLVKGAYWDTEIKHAQVMGFPNFPVFTTKPGTDLSYLACAQALLEAAPDVYPQFATHNAYTLAAIEQMAEAAGQPGFEYQRLHGMGEPLYGAAGEAHRVRIYAPVGAHQDLLPYLVRRLLENGANTSFVHAFLDPDVPVEHVVEDPIAKLEAGPRRHPQIPTPPRLFGPERRNSTGLDLTVSSVRDEVRKAIRDMTNAPPIEAVPLLAGKAPAGGASVAQPNPSETAIIMGRVREAADDDVRRAAKVCNGAQRDWDRRGGAERGAILRAMGDGLEEAGPRLIALMARETGKTLQDGIDEVREAVDFCRYYATEAEAKFAAPERLPGPSGETNHLSLHGRGVFGCISPWNFPLAIFTGQVAAALGAGNTVLAKPAEQSPLVAFEAVKIFRKAGVPEEVLALLPGRGETVGAAITGAPETSGIAFTGGTSTARLIQRSLAGREGPILPLIAETGGLNAMFVDTTALREQVIDDVIHSAFGSAGQRCSALRLLFLPDETADMMLDGLKGAMDELKIGDPCDFDTDVGPVIDAGARDMLEAYVGKMSREATLLKQVDVSAQARQGHFFGPALIELKSLDQIDHEMFGPVLHVLRYDPDEVGQVGAALMAKGYGLTLGVHSRLESFWREVIEACPMGNTYINRSMTGAVVGVQPFGGEGLSGTGPKAGGPHYLARFATERTVTNNITAQGGDPELLSLS
jgi:RHH-type transcriptional regulator, proline utilization regulon repressor / proline dehydrogenase / delta 1-pyrroline-5-carboxylate dehydrogenase